MSNSDDRVPMLVPVHSKVTTNANGRVLRWWCAQEDDALLSTVKERTDGKRIRWSDIRKVLPWRTLDEIRGRWRRMRNSANVVGRTKCKLCGVQRLGHSCPGITITTELAPETTTQEHVAPVITLRLRGTESSAARPRAVEKTITKAKPAREFLELHPYVLWSTPPLGSMAMHPFEVLSTPRTTRIELDDSVLVA